MQYSRDFDCGHKCHHPGLAWPRLGVSAAPQCIPASHTGQDTTGPDVEHSDCAPLPDQRIRSCSYDIVRDRQAILLNTETALI